MDSENLGFGHLLAEMNIRNLSSHKPHKGAMHEIALPAKFLDFDNFQGILLKVGGYNDSLLTCAAYFPRLKHDAQESKERCFSHEPLCYTPVKTVHALVST